MRFSIRPRVWLPFVAVLTAVGCSSTDGTVEVSAPSPSAAEAGYCEALHAKLPDAVNGMKRRTTAPASDYTAAWGDPAIELRCGGPRPKILTPGNEHYNPSADAMELNGVSWLPERLPGGGVRATTTLRKASVEVVIPGKYTGEAGDVSALTDFADAVRRTVPTGV